MVNAGKMSKGDKLGPVDHNTVEYPPFRKNFYIEVPELARLSEEEVTLLRKDLDGIKVWGRTLSRGRSRRDLCGSILTHLFPSPGAGQEHPQAHSRVDPGGAERQAAGPPEEERV